MIKTNDSLLRKIKAKARHDARNRRDRRFLDTLAFLTAKGFLKTNVPVRPQPNKRLRVDEAIWAGLHVEPRILEVLPAAVLRLEAHFDFDPEEHPQLHQVLQSLRAGNETGPDFYAVPFKKLKAWINLRLPDRRTKTLAERKVVKQFRLSPTAVENLIRRAGRLGCTQTEVLESLLRGTGGKG